MANLNMYKTKTTSSLLPMLRYAIAMANTRPDKKVDIKIRHIIKELQSRDLTENQYILLNKYILRFAWI